MKIALDLDGTYSADPDLWDEFIARAKMRGHEVICVTNRPFEPVGIRIPSVEILLAGAEYKNAYASAEGHKVDIWIDDQPGTISPPVDLP